MRRPPNPYVILISSLVLPASGQVWNGQPARGLMFLFFIFLLGGFTLITADEHISFVGRYAGGFCLGDGNFDAYRQARIRYAIWQHEDIDSRKSG